MSDYDAIVVGSGLSSLVCAANLARNNWRVGVFERNEHLGGAILTTELTVPGFKHEAFSCFHPLFVGSEAFKLLGPDLTARGLKYLSTDVSFSTLTSDGRTATLTTSHEKNCAAFEQFAPGDGEAWHRTVEEFTHNAPLVFSLQNADPTSFKAARLIASALLRRGRAGLLRLGAELTETARAWLEHTYRSDEVRALLSPWPLHQGLGPDDAASGLSAKVLAWAGEEAGQCVPEGGGSRLVDTLVGIIRDHGGQCYTGRDVDTVIVREGKARGVRFANGSETTASRAVICNVTPTQLFGRLLREEAIPAHYRDAARKFRYGPGDMRMHIAMSEPPKWLGDADLVRCPYITLTPGMNAVSLAHNEARCGLLPATPTVGCGQPCTMDPGRAPDNGWILWIEILGLPAQPRGDAAREIDTSAAWSYDVRERFADRVQGILSRNISNLDSAILGRTVWSPLDLEAANINLVGGHHCAGSMAPDQLFFGRPFAGERSYGTPVAQLHQIGASTAPGAGLSGQSGLAVSQMLLRKRFPRTSRPQANSD